MRDKTTVFGVHGADDLLKAVSGRGSQGLQTGQLSFSQRVSIAKDRAFEVDNRLLSLCPFLVQGAEAAGFF